MMKLAKREKYLVSIAVCAIAVFLLFQFLIFPFFEERKRIQRGIRAKEAGLKEITRLGAEYRVHKKGFQGIDQILAKRSKGFTLFSFLEKAAGETELKGHIKYMKPSSSVGTGPYKESMVEMKLDGITLNQLVGYLYLIESPENIINIKRISIKENRKESGYLDVILQVLTFQ
jgi:general secretion pathway protein M